MTPIRTHPKLVGPRRKGKRPTKAALAEARRKLIRYEITLQMVADEAAKTARYGTMNPATVSGALYKGNSRNAFDAALRLIAEAESRNGAVAVAS
jgi:hypothetical protein